MALFLLAVEPFWGRAIVYDMETKDETQFSIPLVLSNDYASSYLEAVNSISDLKNQLKENFGTIEFSTIVIEVTEAQSDETQQAILTAAKSFGFEKAELVLYENTRLISALNHLIFDPFTKHQSIKVAVIDIWENEAFGHLLECKNVTTELLKFKPYGYYSIQSESDDGFEVSELKLFAKKLCFDESIDAVVIASGDYNNECKNIFSHPIFYDANERRGTLLKAIALNSGLKTHVSPESNNLHIDVVDTLEYSLKLVIGNQKIVIAEAYDELPVTFQKVITLDKPVNTLEFCRQWPSSELCESYGRTTFDYRNAIKIKCTIDKLRKIDLAIE